MTLNEYWSLPRTWIILLFWIVIFYFFPMFSVYFWAVVGSIYFMILGVGIRSREKDFIPKDFGSKASVNLIAELLSQRNFSISEVKDDFNNYKITVIREEGEEIVLSVVTSIISLENYENKSIEGLLFEYANSSLSNTSDVLIFFFINMLQNGITEYWALPVNEMKIMINKYKTSESSDKQIMKNELEIYKNSLKALLEI